MASVFKIRGREGKKSSNWYGKVKCGDIWRRVKLFTDKAASASRLADLQRQADQRAAGMITADTDRLALPISELAKQYIASLRAQNKDAEHVRISEWMLRRMIEAGRWQSFPDITVDSLEKMLPAVAKTASYQNKFIVRAKAFVHWALPDGWGDPLKKLRRVKEKGAKRTRERRAGTEAEIAALLKVAMPEHRTLAYALAAFNGLRRNEASGLMATDLHMDAMIPFMGLRQKQGQNDSRDYIPIHPYVHKLLKGRLLMPGAKVLPSVPDMKTMKKDLQRVGITLKDAQGRRLDYHALRHSFSTRLDQTGCSRATKKRLMRHAHEDVTDGYTHAELAEMLTALMRVPSPDSAQVQTPQAVRTGTDGVLPIATSGLRADHQLDQTLFRDRQPLTPIGAVGAARATLGTIGENGESAVSKSAYECHSLLMADNRDIIAKTGPSTQAD